MTVGHSNVNELINDDGVAGYPIQIVSVDEDHNYTLNEEELTGLLSRSDIKNKKVVMISIAGAFRKGKSFLLNFFLRYLNKNSNTSTESDSIHGFKWEGGSKRQTTGVLLWSEPFLRKNSEGEEVAIFLMDTQGTFDSNSTVKDCATIFALSTMLSSIQIYNLSQNIQEDDFQHLQLFTEYGRLTQDDYDTKPFQNIIFLIRDWSYPYEYEYGYSGGNNFLNRKLELSDGQHPELMNIRKHIRTCFSSLKGFLLPHPGLKVSTSPNFKGNLSEIDETFVEQIKELSESVLKSENLVVKEINGNQITCHELIAYFKAYVNIYQSNELPEPKTMLEATAEANNMTAVDHAYNLYYEEMETTVGAGTPYKHPDCIKAEFENAKKHALSCFVNIKKMGGPTFSEHYKEGLLSSLSKDLEERLKKNEDKNIWGHAKTPIALFSILVILYIASGVLSILSLSTLAVLLNYSMGIILIMFGLWTYSKLNGILTEIVETVDLFADFVSDLILYHIFNKFSNSNLGNRALTSGLPIIQQAMNS